MAYIGGTLKHGAGIPRKLESGKVIIHPPGTTYEEMAENISIIRQQLQELNIPEPSYFDGIAYDLTQWKNESEAKLDEIKEISEGLADYVENSFYGGLTEVNSEIDNQTNFFRECPG